MKHAPLIQTKNLNVTLNFFAPEPAQAVTAQLASDSSAFYAQGLKTGFAMTATPPAIGTYWEGQGGIYAGVRQYEDGLFHVVFAKEDVGSHAWGRHGEESEATSKTEGLLNTTILIQGDHPAAKAAAIYSADGHHDFYLPSIGELNHAWQFIPEALEKEWYWSSSQFSAYNAYFMGFDVAGSATTARTTSAWCARSADSFANSFICFWAHSARKEDSWPITKAAAERRISSLSGCRPG